MPKTWDNRFSEGGNKLSARDKDQCSGAAKKWVRNVPKESLNPSPFCVDALKSKLLSYLFVEFESASWWSHIQIAS